MDEVDLTVDLGKLVLSNPVIAASGTFGYGLEHTEFWAGCVSIQKTSFTKDV